MASTISEPFVEQFRSNVIHKYQQGGSRLNQTVYFEGLVGDTHNFELIDAVDAVWKTTTGVAYADYDRHKDTPILDAPHSRRKVSPTDAEWGDLVDREDKLRMIISPESEYNRAASNSLGRATDDLVILAVRATATTGSSTQAYDTASSITDNGTLTLSGDDATTPTLGLTFDKVNAALQLHNQEEVDDEDRWAVIDSNGVRHLLNQTKPTSADYVAGKALMEAGIVRGWMGYNWIRSERLPGASKGPANHLGGDVVSAYFYSKRAIGLAVNEDMFTRIAERPDKSFAHQVYCRMTKGAVRLQEVGVIDVHFDKTAIPA